MNNAQLIIGWVVSGYVKKPRNKQEGAEVLLRLAEKLGDDKEALADLASLYSYFRPTLKKKKLNNVVDWVSLAANPGDVRERCKNVTVNHDIGLIWATNDHIVFAVDNENVSKMEAGEYDPVSLVKMENLPDPADIHGLFLNTEKYNLSFSASKEEFEKDAEYGRKVNLEYIKIKTPHGSVAFQTKYWDMLWKGAFGHKVNVYSDKETFGKSRVLFAGNGCYAVLMPCYVDD